MNKQPWTDEDYKRARELRDACVTYREIARILGRREKAVSAKLQKPNGNNYLAKPAYFAVEGITGQELVRKREKQGYRVHEQRRPGETLHDCLRRIGA